MRLVARASALIAAALLGLPAGALAAGPPVSVFPSPGSKAALPGSQIAFRGIPATQIGPIQVVGSRTGAHTGHVAGDSDGQGGSFLPDTPFAAGETVTVTTTLNVIGGSNGAFQFTVIAPAGAIGPEQIPLVSAGSDGLQRFRTRPDLVPPSITVTKRGAPAGPGDILIAPQQGPAQNGPMLLDSSGNLLWFQPLPTNSLATDFRVQRLGNQSVLTWWQGTTNHGSGRGEGVIYDHNYRLLAEVKAVDGLQGADLHEFLITPQGQAYMIVASPVKFPGTGRPLMDSVVQEIDIKTGLLLFEWHALDHIPLSESFYKSNTPGLVYDPYHLNSITIDYDGNLILSMRNTWAEYKVDRQTGAVIWTLGSNRNNFKLGAGTRTAFQHDAVVQSDGTFTIFDDGAGPPDVHSQSRAIKVRVNEQKKTVTLLKQYEHTPPLLSTFEGGVQVLPGGDVFVGWGEVPYFSEFNRAGRVDFDAHFTAPTNSYRAYRFPWSGQPLTTPDVAMSHGADGVSTVYASWNGATDVGSWRVLAGSTPTSLGPVGTARRRGFETPVPVRNEQPYFSVQALGYAGNVLAKSGVTGSNATRVSVFGHSAFVAGGGGGLNVGCFSSSPCHIAATISAGRTVIARTGSESVGANGGGTLFFSLNGAGRSMLARARGHQLGVSVSIRNSDGASSGANLNLISYGTSGPAPAYSITESSTLQLFGRSAFVSGRGVGGLFVGCFASSACHVRATLTSGRTVLARTGTEYVGGPDCGNVIFNLTSAGQRLLAGARGNQLPVTVTLSAGPDTVTARMALVRWG
jgi:Arylsulfotransferase (ASST)